MSARERLIQVLSGGYESQRVTAAMVADEILTEHAHELAEEMISLISDPWHRSGLGWESAVQVIRDMYPIQEEK